MKALVVNDGRLELVQDYPEPQPGADEALIKVLAAGICETDLQIIKGYLGFSGVLGHEFVGVVQECVHKELIGKRVVGEINCGCGKCTLCQQGLSRHCAQRTVLGIAGRDGAFASYLSLPIQNLHVVPDSLDNLEAVFVEPLAAAYEILAQVHIKPSQEVLVLGDGKLGQLIAQGLRFCGAKLLVAGKHPAKLAILKNQNIDTCLSSQVGNHRFDIVIEATGSPDGLAHALEYVKPWGRIVLKSTTTHKAQLDLAPIVIHEVSILGSRCGPYPPALQALAWGWVQVRPLISGQFSLDQGLQALEQASKPETLKIIINMEH